MTREMAHEFYDRMARNWPQDVPDPGPWIRLLARLDYPFAVAVFNRHAFGDRWPTVDEWQATCRQLVVDDEQPATVATDPKARIAEARAQLEKSQH